MKPIAITLVALLALLAMTCGGAYIDLGRGNLALGLGIAAAKVALVAWFFMRLPASHPLVRVSCLLALTIVGLLFLLSGVDLASRQEVASPWQQPEQIAPLLSR